MYAPSKIVHGIEIVCCFTILVLVIHVGGYGHTYFGASPTITVLFLVAFSNLMMNFFIFVTATNSVKIYETPLICMHTVVFFVLQVTLGMAAILESKIFESFENKEIGAAGGISIFAALASVIGCYNSSNMCKHVIFLKDKIKYEKCALKVENNLTKVDLNKVDITKIDLNKVDITKEA